MHKERVSEGCVTCQVAWRLSLADGTQGHKELTPGDGRFWINYHAVEAINCCGSPEDSFADLNFVMDLYYNIFFLLKNFETGMVVKVCNPHIQEAEDPLVWGLSGMYSELKANLG